MVGGAEDGPLEGGGEGEEGGCQGAGEEGEGGTGEETECAWG